MLPTHFYKEPDYLSTINITTDNQKLAIWLSNESVNKDDLEKADNITEVLLFKQAISLGWDCPRAAVLLIFRELQQETFTIQTVGRILRMPQQKHYADDALNYGYVFTNLSKDIIKIVADDLDYILEKRADRKPEYQVIELQSSYINTRIVRNRLGVKFKRCLFESAEQYFGITREISAKKSIYDINKEKMSGKFLEMNIEKIEIPIPKDIKINQIEIGETYIEVQQKEKFAKTNDELNILFSRFCYNNCGDYAKVDSAPILAMSLVEMFEIYFNFSEIQTKKVILYTNNQNAFITLIDISLRKFTTIKEEDAKNITKNTENYTWEVPEFRIYNQKYFEYQTYKHILQPTFLIKKSEKFFGDSEVEFRFIKFVEQNQQFINWWYKNGVGNRADFAIPYQNTKGQSSLFYVDFVICFSNKTIGLFDTKTKDSDTELLPKHNALIDYVNNRNSKGKNIIGSIIYPDKTLWKFSLNKIENLDELDNWDIFEPMRIIEKIK